MEPRVTAGFHHLTMVTADAGSGEVTRQLSDV